MGMMDECWISGTKKAALERLDCIFMVPKAGLEPARISTVDFESTASTDFATPARKGMRKTLWIIPVVRHHASIQVFPAC